MTCRTVLARDSIRLVGLLMPDRSDVEARRSIVQIKQVGKLKTWVVYAHQL